MKVLCFGVLALCALALGNDLLSNEIPSDAEVSTHLGPYSQEFVFLKGNPEYEPSVHPATTAALERNFLEDAISNILNGFRDIVINGNDVLPPLDPLIIDNIGPVSISVTGVRADVAINNFRAEGLQWYVVDNVRFNPLTLAFGTHITLPWLTVTGTYDAEMRIAILLTHRAGGNFRIFVNRFEIGVDARLGTNLLGGHLTLRQLAIKLDIHDTLISIDGLTGSSVVNSMISGFIQNLTQDIIQSNMASLSQTLSEELFDVVNDLLKNFTISDILG